jgi:hypothetical protein
MLASPRASTALLGRRVAILPVVALTTAFVACGGSSSNGIESKSPEAIILATRAAANSATSVHLTTKTGEVLLDVKLAKNGGTGQLTLSGKTIELTRVGSTLYLKAKPNVYRTLGITARVPTNAWLKAPSAKSGQLAAFTELSGEINRLLLLEPPLTKGPVSTVNGQKAVELKQTKAIYTRSLYVATTGKPYPVKIVIKGQATGETTFADWNQPVTLTPPANSIDLTKLQHP